MYRLCLGFKIIAFFDELCYLTDSLLRFQFCNLRIYQEIWSLSDILNGSLCALYRIHISLKNIRYTLGRENFCLGYSGCSVYY